MQIKFTVFFSAIFILFSSACNKNIIETENGILVSLDSVYYKIDIIDDNIVHVYYSKLHPDSALKSMIVKNHIKINPEWDVKKFNNSVVLSTNKITTVIDFSAQQVKFTDQNQQVILTEAVQSKMIKPTEIDEDKGFTIAQSFQLNENEAIYGFGQHQDGLMSHRGNAVELYQHNMKVAVPVMISTNGYGILWDNYSYTRFQDHDKATWWSELGDGIDYYFIYGPKLDSVISGIRQLTGKAPMLPKWSFGLFHSKAKYSSQKEIINVVENYRKRKVPLDVIVQDWQYWPGKWGAKEFEKLRYPDPAEMINTLHNKYNTRFMISVWPCLEPGSRDYEEMEASGYLYPGHGRKYYDAFNEKARNLYWEQAKRELFTCGTDAWWCDATEPEIKGWDTQIEDYKNMMKPSIGSSTRYLNLYSYMHSKGMYENQRKETSQKRVFILTRSSFAGQQSFGAVTWSGDVSANWETFENQISAGLNFCLSGIPYWTTDIGGFFITDNEWFRDGKFPEGVKDANYHEIFIRWYQFGAFSPVFRVHGAQTPREIWYFGEPGDWAYDVQIKFNNLRYRLLPYIYSLAGKVTLEDYTIMRALPMDFENDQNVFDIGNQYMFGLSFLVCPVTQPKVEKWEVYLPKNDGGWIDFWTGKKISGGTIVETNSPIDIIPLFVKAGSIIPMGPYLQYSDEKPADPIELRIYKGSDGSFTLYEDENDNYNYEHQKYCTIKFEWNDKLNVLTISESRGEYIGMLKKRKINIVLVSENHGTGVEITKKVDKEITYTGDRIEIEIL